MKVRIKFAKQGAMKFIGHLDIMRYFQKAVKRAGLDAAYSEGFSPHMIMSFAAPLGVGITSEGEYFDLELKTPVSSKEAVERLNRVMVEGMEPGENWKEKVPAFIEQQEIRILKKTKKNEKEVDIKPYIYKMEIRGESIFLKLAAGSVKNTKPELVMEAFFPFCGQEFQPSSLLIHRMEVYGDLGEEGERKLVSLEDLGGEIE